MRVLLISSSLINNNYYELRKKEITYLSKVLRLEDGIKFTCKDENNIYYLAELNGNSIYLTPSERPEDSFLDKVSSYKNLHEINLYQSLLKGKKNERVVNDATQIGVHSINFILTEFSERKEFSEHEKERLLSIRKEAVQQSGSSSPIINWPINIKKALSEAKNILFLHQDDLNDSLSICQALTKINNDGPISVFIGPEGGFSSSEVSFALKNNASLIFLRTNILRSETASTYALSALQTYLEEN